MRPGAAARPRREKAGPSRATRLHPRPKVTGKSVTSDIMQAQHVLPILIPSKHTPCPPTPPHSTHTCPTHTQSPHTCMLKVAYFQSRSISRMTGRGGKFSLHVDCEMRIHSSMLECLHGNDLGGTLWRIKGGNGSE